MKRVLTVVMVVAFARVGAGEWVERHAVRHRTGNLEFRSKWHPDLGLHLRMAGQHNGHAVELTLSTATCTATVTDADGRRIPGALLRSRFLPKSLPRGAVPDALVVLKFRVEEWLVYVEGRRVADIRSPFPAPVTVQQAGEELPGQPDRGTRYQKTADFLFHDDFLSAEDDERALGSWETFGGEWALHAAFSGTWEGRVRRLLPGQDMTEFSANFYNLRGKGRSALALAGYPFSDMYEFQASVQIQTGEMGLVFYCRDEDDYFAFTMRKESAAGLVTICRLWHLAKKQNVSPVGAGEKNGFVQWHEPAGEKHVRHVLAAVETDMAVGQWIMPRVRTFHDRVQCFLDDVLVIDVPVDLPVGGRYGLYVDGEQGVLFDDVTARSNRRLPLGTAADVAFRTVYRSGKFRAGGLHGALLTASPTDHERMLVVGSTLHTGGVFSATFEPDGPDWDVGLLIGYTGDDRPHMRLISKRSEGAEVLRLERRTAGTNSVLEQVRAPARAEGIAGPTLMADATSPHVLRLYCDGELALLTQLSDPVTGAAGVLAGSGTGTRVTRMDYSVARENRYSTRFNEKQRFTADPFMRHWSSPEGEWFTDKDGLMWHKSDLFGPFALYMPLVNRSAIHMGVGAGQTNGSLVAYVVGRALCLQEPLDDTRPAIPDGSSGDPDELAAEALVCTVSGQVPPTTNGVAAYMLHCEDRWVWATAATREGGIPVPGRVLFRHRLARPLAGTRIRIAGFGRASLHGSRVFRDMVKDYLFAETPHEWTINGGKWSVVNRFECDPRWTHMNGESRDNLAALWSKHEFSGDFCVELYAGIRHGWYDRCGDLNLTVMADRTAASRGYTVTCTGWDFNHTQTRTRLYRNGKVVDESNKYLVPRFREGNERRTGDPLIKEGRDVHGAWYYIRFRRVNGRIEYYFDNELVFSRADDEPESEGVVGLWTYRNSMMVARLKIAAENIRPRGIEFRPYAPEKARPRTADGAGDWSAQDAIGLADLTWHRDSTDRSRYFVVRNRAGSGSMFAACNLPPRPCAGVAGWRFQVKRTAGACFNFHYSVGARDESGAYVPKHSFFHEISGTDFTRGPVQRQGGTAVAGVASLDPEWHADGTWTTVEVKMPIESFRTRVDDPAWLLKAEGFGNAQPSYVIQGLTGNGPGEAYAVKAFSAIPYAPPPLAIACEWHPDRQNAILLRSKAPYTDRRLANAAVTVAGSEADIFEEAINRHVVLLPRTEALVQPDGGRVPVEIRAGDRTFRFSLDRGQSPNREPPVLLSVGKLGRFFESFEGRRPAPWVVQGETTVVHHGTDEQGRHMEVRNTATAQRLRNTFSLQESLARYPLLQFRYRPTTYAHVGLSLPVKGVARISEKYGAVVRYSSSFRRGEGWHTWHGLVTDAIRSSSLNLGHFAADSVTMGSHHRWDQTGRYSYWFLDDIVFGPALSSVRDLRLLPRYFSFDGIETVHMVLRRGPEGYDELDESLRAGMFWQKIANGEEADLATAKFRDGVYHVFLTARDKRGRKSGVTDIPFLYDSRPMEIFRFFVETGNPIMNQSVLNVLMIPGPGSPPALGELQLFWNDTRVPVGAGPLYGTMGPHGHDLRLSLNWPYIFRKQLDEASDGDSAIIGVRNVQDGAGNRSPDITSRVRINYAKDRLPPTLLQPAYPGNVFLVGSVEGHASAPPGIEVGEEHEVTVLVQPSKDPSRREPYLSCTAKREGWPIRISGGRDGWDPARYPFFSFRFRRRAQPEPSTTERGSGAVRRRQPSRIDVVLRLSDGERCVIPLVQPRTGRDVVNLPEPVTTGAGKWRAFTIDLPDILKRRSRVGAEFPTILAIDFNCARFGQELSFDLQSLYIYAPWDEKGRVVPDAYDVSGVKGFVWSQSEEPGWAEVRARDRVGNISAPMRAPESILPHGAVDRLIPVEI